MGYTHRDMIEVSYSSLGTYGNCARRFAYTKMLRRDRRLFDDSMAAAIGRCLHEAIQHYFIHRDRDKAIEQIALHYPWEQFPETPEYNFEAAVNTFIATLSSSLYDYELVHIDLDDGSVHPAVEVPVMIKYFLEEHDVWFHYRGYVDLILRDPITGEFMIWDIKTMTKKTMSHAQEKYQYDYQNTGYGLVLNALYGTQAQFTTGIMGVVIDLHNPEVITPVHRRREKDMQEFVRWFTWNARQIAEQQTIGWFPRNPKACKAFNRLCSFHSHCHLKTLDEMQEYANPSGVVKSESIESGTARDKEFVPLLVVEITD